MPNKLEELEQLILPLQKHLQENYGPNCKVVIGSDGVQIVKVDIHNKRNEIICPYCYKAIK